MYECGVERVADVRADRTTFDSPSKFGIDPSKNARSRDETDEANGEMLANANDESER